MTIAQRMRLLAFGLVTWMSGMFTAADTTAAAVVMDCAPLMVGIGAGLFATALLPGRMARFS